MIKEAFVSNDAGRVRQLLEQHPELKAKINEPRWAFDSPAITHVRNREMLDVLLEAGADINARSHWWAGGFGLLDCAEPDLAAYAIERGAIVDAHAAARLGMLQRLSELITRNPELVHARGGDGQTPLHFASTIEIAAYLLDHGANIDARDVDHESTPAQYMIRDRQEIVRYLIKRGCHTDILMAAALGDVALARKHLDANADCIHLRVTDVYLPMINQRRRGTIYQRKLCWYVSPHEVAKQVGHEEIFQLLMERSPTDVKLIAACWCGNESAMKAMLEDHPDLVRNLSKAYRRHTAHAARNNDLPAVRLMLAAGLPVDASGQHRGTPLHWAAWHGNAQMVQAILPYGPPLESADNDFHATPMNWALHGSENGWHRQTGNYPATVEALIGAGGKLPEKVGGSEAVKALLRKYGCSR